MSVLIFDDDPNCCELIAQVLRSMSVESRKFSDGSGALEAVRRLKPSAVVLDIMMPGMDGLTICRALKSDPLTAGIKVIIASGKKYAEDRDQAKACGADAFVAKPFRIREIKELFAVQRIGEESGGGAVREERAPVMSFEVWGCRSAGNPALGTASAAVDIGGRRILLDAGSGLAAALGAQRDRAKDVWLLLTHFHEDHVSGLPALAQLGPEWALRVAGPSDTRVSPGQLMRAALGDKHAGARVQIFSAAESRFELWPEVRIATLLTRHPGATAAYRIEYKDRSIVYCPDNELETAEEVETDYTEKFARFIRGADLVVHDARFTDEEYPSRIGQGHGSPAMILAAAAREGVRRVALFHMDARYGPAELEAMLAAAREKLRSEHSSLEVDMAAPGLIFSV